MIKNYLSYFLLFFSFFALNAQTEIKIQDASGPVPGCHIQYTNSEKVTKAKTTDSEGRAQLYEPNLQPGSPLFLRISYIGFKTIYDTIFYGTPKAYQLEVLATQLNDFVVTGQYTPKPNEQAVHNITIIDRKKIDALGAITLKDALTNELSIQVGRDNVLGSSVSMQGLSGQGVKIMVDGVPIIGRQNGNIDLSQINLNNIERIEVVEGPLAVSYGTDALAGVINLITKKGNKETLYTTINSYTSSVGDYNLDATVGVKVKKHRFGLTGMRNYFDGWSPDHGVFQPVNEYADSNRFNQWKPKEQRSVEGRYAYQWKKLGVVYTAKLFDELVENKGAPRKPYGETTFDETYFTRRVDNSLKVNGKIGNQSGWNVLIAYNDFLRRKNTYFVDLTTLERQLTEQQSDQDTAEFKQFLSRGIYATAKDSAKINFELGYEVENQFARGKRITGLEQWLHNYAVFASMEYTPIQSLIIRPGLRYAYNSIYTPPVLPSIHLKYRKGKLDYRCSYAMGYRAPSLKELYFEFVDINHNIVGNKELSAETSHSLNGSIKYSEQLENQMEWRLQLKGYYNYITDRITLAQKENGSQFSYLNIGLFKTTGGQLMGGVTYKDFQVDVGGSIIGRYNRYAQQEVKSDFLYAFETNSSIKYLIPKVKVGINVLYKYTGKTPNLTLDANDNIIEGYVDAYHMADLSINKNFWEKRLSVIVGCKNGFDVKNIVSNQGGGGAHSAGSGQVPLAMGRYYFATLQLNLQSKK